MTATREELREAFMAGFEASGEGWNAEYPFRSHANPATPEDHALLDQIFEKHMAKREEKAADIASFVKMCAEEYGPRMDGFRAFRNEWELLTGERLDLKAAHEAWKAHR